MFTVRYLRSVGGCTCGGTASDIIAVHEPMCGWEQAPDPHEMAADVERAAAVAYLRERSRTCGWTTECPIMLQCADDIAAAQHRKGDEW